MDLDQYLTKNDIKDAEFGKRIDRTAQAVNRYRRRERIPDRDTMLRIAKETRGEVTANDFYGIPEDACALASTEPA